MFSSQTYVPGSGNPKAKLMIVGIAPGLEETIRRESFVGPSGQILEEDLADAGIKLSDCYKTNVFKYKLPDNDFYRYKEIGLSLQPALEELQVEISKINPNCILGLGNPVLFALTGKGKGVEEKGEGSGINKYRGSILHSFGKKCVFTWHQAAELHGKGEGQWRPWQRYVRKFDVARAVEQSNYSETRIPSRLLHIAGDSSSVYRFIERNKDNEYCAVDIESIEGIPVCIGLSFSIHEALSIPLWNTVEIHSDNLVAPKKSYKYKLEVSTIPDSDLAFIWQLLARLFLNRKIKFIGQNFKYDEDKLNKLGFYFHSLYADILIGQHAISSELPKSLAFQTSIYTLEPYYKDEGRDYVPGKDSIKDLLLYNCKDAAVTLEIFFAQEKERSNILFASESYYGFRMGLHKLYHNIEAVGFATEDSTRTALISKYLERLVSLEVELHALLLEFGIERVINLSSPKQLAQLFYSDLNIPLRKGTGEEVVTALLANTVKDKSKKRILEIILGHRRVNKTLGTYLASENDYDGRMKTTYQICGTESFRTSTQILRQPLRPKEIGWALQTVTKHGDTGNDLRSILIADPGYIFVNIDQSQAEARVCSLLANDFETLKLYDSNDIHALTASKVFGGEEKTWSKKVLGYECPERFCGKTARHAYHLAIGKRELMINMNTDARKYKIPLNISEWKAGQILEALRQMTPKIQEVFHEEIKRCLSRDRRLYGTFGASFYLYEDWGNDLFKAAYSRIPQQTVTDKTKSVALRCLKEIWDCKIVGESHDALLFLCPERKLDDYIPLICGWFHIPVDFSGCSLPRPELVIPCEVEVGYNYEKLEKWRKKNDLALTGS